MISDKALKCLEKSIRTQSITLCCINMCTAAVLLHYDLFLNIEHYKYLVLEAYFKF